MDDRASLAPLLASIPGSTIVAVLLGLSWASARAADGAASIAELPQGLDGLTLPAALVLAAWLIRGTAVSVTIRHVHALDPESQKSLVGAVQESTQVVCREIRRAARVTRGDDPTEERAG